MPDTDLGVLIMNKTETMFKKVFLLTIAIIAFIPISKAQSNNSVWKKTVIVATNDGSTMEYLIDENTKVTVEKPYLVIETEGIVANYELEKMGQLYYGKKLVDAIDETTAKSTVSFENETLYFDHLPDNSIVCVFSTDGKQIINYRGSGKAHISLSSLAAGTYIVKANNNSFTILKK